MKTKIIWRIKQGAGQFRKSAIWLLLVTFVILAVTSSILGKAPAAEKKKADMSQLLIVGDSLLAGFQNYSLLDSLQANSIPALIARQAGVELAQPLIMEPGIPPALILVDPGPPPVIIPKATVPPLWPFRVDPYLQPMNLAVPGHRVLDALAIKPPCLFIEETIMTDVVLGMPGCFMNVFRSQVEWAEALYPSTIIIWIGANDSLGAAINADTSFLTPPMIFEAAYTEMMERLAATGATLVVANIPDVTLIPFLTSAEDVAELVGLPLDIIGPLLGIVSGDFVTPDAMPLIEKILDPSDPMFGPLPDEVVLTVSEVVTIRAANETFNDIIATQAKVKGAALLDAHTLFNKFHEKGYVVGGQRLTTDFLGGLFSLDGIHLTNTGFAIGASEFIKVLNRNFAAGIPPVNVRQIQKDDPLVLPGVGRPASALKHIDAETVKSMRRMFGHKK